MDIQARLWDLEQARLTIYAVRVTSSKFGLHARRMGKFT